MLGFIGDVLMIYVVLYVGTKLIGSDPNATVSKSYEEANERIQRYQDNGFNGPY